MIWRNLKKIFKKPIPPVNEEDSVLSPKPLQDKKNLNEARATRVIHAEYMVYDSILRRRRTLIREERARISSTDLDATLPGDKDLSVLPRAHKDAPICEVANIRTEIESLRADVASQMAEKDEEIARLKTKINQGEIQSTLLLSRLEIAELRMKDLEEKLSSSYVSNSIEEWLSGLTQASDCTTPEISSKYCEQTMEKSAVPEPRSQQLLVESLIEAAPEAPIEPSPIKTGPIEPSPIETGPESPIETRPIEPSPIETGPKSPIETGPIEPSAEPLPETPIGKQMVTISIVPGSTIQIDHIRKELDQGRTIQINCGQTSVLVIKDVVNESSSQVAALRSERLIQKTAEMRIKDLEEKLNSSYVSNPVDELIGSSGLTQASDCTSPDISSKYSKQTMAESAVPETPSQQLSVVSLIETESPIDPSAESPIETEPIEHLIETESPIEPIIETEPVVTISLVPGSAIQIEHIRKKLDKGCIVQINCGQALVLVIKSLAESTGPETTPTGSGSSKLFGPDMNIGPVMIPGSSCEMGSSFEEEKMKKMSEPEVKCQISAKSNIKTMTEEPSIELKSHISTKSTEKDCLLEVAACQVINSSDSHLSDSGPYPHTDQIVLYTTTVGVVRDTVKNCKKLRDILKNNDLSFYEKDVSLGVGFLEELHEILGPNAKLPSLFIGGRFIGGVKEAVRLDDSQQLVQLFNHDGERGICQGCGGTTVMICEFCSGSHKIFVDDIIMPCPYCFENGLVQCTVCAI